MHWLGGIFGATAGGIAGYYLFFILLINSGFYAFMLPSVLVGDMSRTHSLGIGILAACVAAALDGLSNGNSFHFKPMNH